MKHRSVELSKIAVQTAAISDRGTKKPVNQDAVMLKVAQTREQRTVTMAVLCDGLGGLSHGEAASAAFVSRMEDWFFHQLPEVLSGVGETQELAGGTRHSDFRKNIRSSWESIVDDMNDRISDYGKMNGFQLGTTALCFLLLGEDFLLMNIGDSRLYKVTDTAEGIRQLTHDHSLVQQQIDRGEITPAEAELSANRSVLLQCVGASRQVYPDFFYGNVTRNSTYLLCSDGFWRKLSLEELELELNPPRLGKEAEMNNCLHKLVDRVKRRGEEDNISAILVSCKINEGEN